MVMVGIVRHVLKHDLQRVLSLSTRLCNISCMKSPSAEQGEVSFAISGGVSSVISAESCLILSPFF